MGRLLSGALALLIALGGASPAFPQTPATGGGGGGSANIAYAPLWGTAYAGGAWARPLLSTLSWLNQSSSTAVELPTTGSAAGPIAITNPGGAGFNWYVLGKTPGTAPWTVSALVSFQTANGSSRYGLCAGSSANGNMTSIGLQSGGFKIDQWTGINVGTPSYSGEPIGATTLQFPVQTIWLQFHNDGTNLSELYSYDGINYTSMGTQTLASFQLAVNNVGPCADGYSGQVVVDLWALVFASS